MVKMVSNLIEMLLTLFLTSLQKISSKFKTSPGSHSEPHREHAKLGAAHTCAQNAAETENLKICPSKLHFCPHNVYIIS